MPLESDSKRWRYLAAVAISIFTAVALVYPAIAAPTPAPATPAAAPAKAAPVDPAKTSHQWWYCDRFCNDSNGQPVEFHVFTPGAATSATDYNGGVALLNSGTGSMVMAGYEMGCPDDKAAGPIGNHMGPMIIAGTPPAQTFAGSPPPPRADPTEGAPDAGPLIPGQKGGHPPVVPPVSEGAPHACFAPSTAKHTLCPTPAAVKASEGMAVWEGVMYFDPAAAGSAQQQHIFVPCATNTASKIATYAAAAKLDPGKIIFFTGTHQMTGVKIQYKLTHQPNGLGH